jgi:tetratricopeptide (TPR) repeat protein
MSLTKDQLLLFIEKPGLLKEQTIGDLKEIVDEFPYFQSAQLLYTYNLHTRANFRYDAYLKICSIYATDRSILYRLLQPKSIREQFHKQPLTAETKAQESTPLFELSEENLITITDFPEFSSVEPTEPGIINFDMLSFDQQDDTFQLDEPEQNLEELAPAQTIKAEPKPVEKVDLIEQFIKVNPTIQPRIEISSTQKELTVIKDEADSENDEYITETLSRIYLKQGHYKKAIDSFKRLSLKFPEKSVYFAQQIEEIKKLLN